MMDWIPFISSYPVWVRIFFIIWLLAGFSVFVFVPRNIIKTKPTETHTASLQQNPNVGSQQNNQISANTVNVYQAIPLVAERPLKEQIREVLRSINPIIIERIDSGETGIAVMINGTKLPELIRLSKNPAFGDFLEIQRTGSISMGGHNTIGGHLNDVDDVGTLQGYRLVFKKALKE